jgi:serine/threonine-protein kinase SRK2|tara:strand:- start:423 stop:662 length:240 start_codon:yes stop_codon:yes gene_type:complete
LIAKIFVVDPLKRYSIKDIKAHGWFLKNLPAELQTSVTNDGPPPGEMQDLDQLMRVVDAAKVCVAAFPNPPHRPFDAPA